MTSLKVSICLVAVVLVGSIASAKQELGALEKRAAIFLLKQSTLKSQALKSAKFFSSQNEICEDDKPKPSSDCISYVAGSYPSTDERVRAARACAGNHGVSCATYVAGSYPSFSEREAAALACRNVSDLSCAKFVAGSYPSNSERVTAAKACKNASLECVKYTAGSYPSFSERVAAANACGGN